MCDQFLHSCLRALPKNDDRMHCLAPLVARNSDYRDLCHGGMRADGVFHLNGVNVLSPGDDHVLDSISQVQEVVFVNEPHVAGAIPAVAQYRFSFLWLLPVFAHEVAASRTHLPRLSSRKGIAERIGDLQLDAEQRSAGGRERVTSMSVILWSEEGERRSRLGHAISLEEVGIGKHLQPSNDEIL